MRRCNLIYLLHSIAIKIVRSGMDSKYDALLEILRLEGLRAVANDILPDATRNGKLHSEPFPTILILSQDSDRFLR